MTSKSKLLAWSIAISNIRKCIYVIGEKEPQATRHSGVFDGSETVFRNRWVGNSYGRRGLGGAVMLIVVSWQLLPVINLEMGFVAERR